LTPEDSASLAATLQQLCNPAPEECLNDLKEAVEGTPAELQSKLHNKKGGGTTGKMKHSSKGAGK
jgi:hypothetical protein